MRNYKDRTCNCCGAGYTPKTGNSKYCDDCSGRESLHQPHKEKMLNYKYRLGRLLAGAKKRATSKGLPYDLDLAYLIDMYDNQGGRCLLTGTHFDLHVPENGRLKLVNPDAPSIDRITPKKGYTKGNVRLVTYHMNVALAEFGEDTFLQLATAYLNKGGVQ